MPLYHLRLMVTHSGIRLALIRALPDLLDGNNPSVLIGLTDTFPTVFYRRYFPSVSLILPVGHLFTQGSQ